MAPKKQTNSSFEKNINKKTSSSGKMSMVKTSSMNKHKRASFKFYKGQGK